MKADRHCEGALQSFGRLLGAAAGAPCSFWADESEAILEQLFCSMVRGLGLGVQGLGSTLSCEKSCKP